MLAARRVKLLSLAALMSAGTVLLTQHWMHGAVNAATERARSSAESASASAAAARQVLVASTALPAGSIIKPGQVRWQAWPASTPTGDFLTRTTTQLEAMNGAVVRTSLDAGEPLTAARVVQPGDRSFLSAVLRPGYRAVTVNVTAATGGGGFVMPGDHVDLILSRSLDASGQKHDFVSETVLQDLRVLAMDQRGAAAKKDVVVPQTATLEVTPKGAEIVAVSSQVGPLTLSLRSLADPAAPASLGRVITRTTEAEATGAPATTPPVRQARAERRKASPAPAGPPFGIIIIRGAALVPTAVAAAPTFRSGAAPRPNAYPGV